MTTTPTAAIPATKSRRRRWLRVILLVFAGAILIPLGIYVYLAAAMQLAWDAAVAEAERDLPRWHLHELEEDRPKVPDAENSALHMIAVAAKAPRADVAGAPNYEKIFEKLAPNVALNDQQSQLIRGRLAVIQTSLSELRKLKAMPRGRYPITYSDMFIIGARPAEHQTTWMFADWLSHDALLLAHDRKPDEAIESCQSILNAGRALDGELLLSSHLLRMNMQRIHVTTLERILAQDTPSEESLRSLQALLDKEIKESSPLPAMRGERAAWHHFAENLKNGKLKSADLRGWNGGRRSNQIGDVINAWLIEVFPSTALKFFPEGIRGMNRMVEVLKLPVHEREAKLQELESECKDTNNLLFRSFPTGMIKVYQSDACGQAILRAALAAVACERYRLTHKDNLWPESLDALVQAKLIDAVPIDPFNKRPLRYRRTKKGIVIYSVGIDLKDDGGHIDRDRKSNESGLDQGFRMWNLDQRRRTPRPTVVFPGAEGAN